MKEKQSSVSFRIPQNKISLYYYVTLGKLSNFSQPYFPNLQNGELYTYLVRLLER